MNLLFQKYGCKNVQFTILNLQLVNELFNKPNN
jgi:hypothetical protein